MNKHIAPEDLAQDDQPHDPGAYIGHEPEFAAETIPGGLHAADERVSAHDTQSSGVGALDKRETQGDLPPHGHREASSVSDDDVRRAGERG
jgi:hypothetical protein